MTDSEMKRLKEENDQLRDALKEAMFCKHLAQKHCVKVDPAGNTYLITWTSQALEWAELAGIDLADYGPSGCDL